MIPDGPDVMAVQAAVKTEHGSRSWRFACQATPDGGPARRRTGPRRSGSDPSGVRQPRPRAGATEPRHVRDVLRDVHGTLVKQGIRDEVTLIASGGIALAEHVAKAIICGADLVAIDIPLVLALECRLCGECQRGEPCPIALEEIDAGITASIAS